MAFNSISGTSNSSVSKGIGGLVSGMDTDELVTGMTADIQNKIDKQLQEKQKTEWQQETYRSLTKAMSEFNNKYFSSTSTTNITNPDFFSSYILNNPDVSSKYVSLSGAIEKANNVKVNQILQLAEKAKYNREIDMSQRMTGTLDTDKIKNLSGSTLTFYLDGITKDITLDDIDNSTDLASQLNEKLREAFGTRATNLYKTTDNHYVLKEGNRYFKANEDGSYINDSSGNAQEEPISDASQLTQIYRDAVQVSTDSNGIQFKLTDKSSTFALHNASTASILGAEKGALKVEAGTSGKKLEIDLGAVSVLSGSKLEFTIDGVKKTVDLGNDIHKGNLGNILDRRFKEMGLSDVTVSVADGKLTLDGGTKIISIDGASGGQYKDAVILGKATNGILDRLYNNGSKNVTTSLNPSQSSPALTKDQLAENLSGLELSFTIEHEEKDGSKVIKNKTIRLGTVTDMADLEKQLNEKLKNAFGEDTVIAKVEDGNISFTSEKETIKIQTFQADVFSNDKEGIIGINAGTSSKLNLNMSLSEIVDGYDKVESAEQRKLTINGVDIEIELHDTLSSIMQKVNHSGAGVTMTYSPMTGKIMMESNNTGALEKIAIGNDKRTTSAVEEMLFGVGKNDGRTKIEDGKNSRAVLTIDGTEMTVERASNNISIDGMNMTFKEVYKNDETSGATALPALDFNVSTDTDKVVENIKGFVDAYNAIVKAVSDEINTRHDRKYPPLTDAQREEMTDSQIEKWEAKAREGLLYQDTALSGVLSQLRLSLYQSVDGVTGFITDCGISTGDYADNGQLKIDETKLRKVLTENPSMVVDLFTKQSDIDFIAEPKTAADTEDVAVRKKESGLMVRFQDILQRAVGTGSVKGTLLQMAGLEGDRTNDDNTFTTRLEDIDDKIDDLKKELASAQERYWSQFTALEKYINQMNQQSSAILGQFGYSQ